MLSVPYFAGLNFGLKLITTCISTFFINSVVQELSVLFWKINEKQYFMECGGCRYGAMAVEIVKVRTLSPTFLLLDVVCIVPVCCAAFTEIG